MEAASPVGEFSYLAGDAALDFGNTLGDRGTERPHERLTRYPDLVWWAYGAGIFGGRDARKLLGAARDRPGRAAKVLTRARALRESLHRAFEAVTAAGKPAAADLAVLNDELAHALEHLQLQPGGECCRLEYAEPDEALDRMLWAVARAVVDLLTSGRLRLVKQCAGATCDWLFLDESRNRSRRWCDMRECGNRAKARRHYAKTKKR